MSYYQLVRVCDILFPHDMARFRGGTLRPVGYYFWLFLNEQTGLHLPGGDKQECAAQWLPRLREIARDRNIDIDLPKRTDAEEYHARPEVIEYFTRNKLLHSSGDYRSV